MEIKYTIQGLLIYAAIAAYLLAFLTRLLHFKKTGHLLFLLGFVIASLAFLYRWYDVGHAPLQNLFEVFLFLGMIIYPFSVFNQRILCVGGDCVDMLIGAIVLFPAGFVFSAQPQQLPPALQSPLFVPHVAAYAIAYILMAKAACQSFVQLANLHQNNEHNFLHYEQATYRMICAGFPLLTAGLILGSIWGKLAWGDYWSWDPKELWSLASWLVYVGYFHFRFTFGKSRPRANCIWAIAGLAVIVITLLWVNLSKLFPGLHSYSI